MPTVDALNILGIKTLNLTKKEAKKAFDVACMKYHPDRNPAGHEMMKMVIQAWEALQEKDFPLEMRSDGELYDYGAQINAALNKIVGLAGIEIVIGGSLVWVGNTQYDQKEVFCPPRKFDPKTNQIIPDDEIRFCWSPDGGGLVLPSNIPSI